MSLFVVLGLLAGLGFVIGGAEGGGDAYEALSTLLRGLGGGLVMASLTTIWALVGTRDDSHGS
ncbi:MAG: hypothetical protein JNJ54_11540 [Myxococcaceae bacterium]|nr:hypothetical protein [Myxococcaceae bacterium]